MYGFRPPHVEYLRPKKRSSCAPGTGLPAPGLEVESPDPLVTSGDLLPYQGCGGKPRQQAESGTTGYLPALQHAGELVFVFDYEQPHHSALKPRNGLH